MRNTQPNTTLRVVDGDHTRGASGAPATAPVALRAALEARRFANRVERDVQSGRANGVNGTPSIFINGERYLGPRDVTSLREAVHSTT